MGNLCGKPSSTPDHDPFSHPGHTIAPSASSSNPNPSVSASAARASIPKSASSAAAGRTLGGGGSAAGGRGEEARMAAARAAEERAAKASQATQKGKLARDLAREKARGVNGALGSASRDERRRREVDGVEELRSWN